MEKMIKFNLNTYVLVRITDYGWEELGKKYGADYIQDVIYKNRVYIDDIVWYKFKLHEVITTLSGIKFLANPTPIGVNILIPDNQLLKTW